MIHTLLTILLICVCVVTVIGTVGISLMLLALIFGQ